MSSAVGGEPVYGGHLLPWCCQGSQRGRVGDGGIRTPGRVAPTLDFESSAFNHSATSPEARSLGSGASGNDSLCAGQLEFAAAVAEGGTPRGAVRGFMARAAANRRASSHQGAMSWAPTGSPDCVRPTGADRAGRPARLTGSVHTSARYMVSGSESLAPSSKAGMGDRSRGE